MTGYAWNEVEATELEGVEGGRGLTRAQAESIGGSVLVVMTLGATGAYQAGAALVRVAWDLF